MKETILTGWTFMRWLRLGIGVYALVQSTIEHEPLLAVAGAFLLVMAIFNVGCCGGGACATPSRRTRVDAGKPEDVSFEEIRSDKK